MPSRTRRTAAFAVPVVALAVVIAVLRSVPAPAASRQPVTRLGPEGPVTPVDKRRGFAHNSPVVLADPTEPRFLAVATRLDNPDFGCGLHLSGDGGRTWAPARVVAELPVGADKCYGPELAFDRFGALYYLFVGLQGAGNSPMGAFLVSSPDRGRSFTPPVRVLGPERYMVRLAIDPTAGVRGRIHLAWLEASSDPPTGGLPQPPNPIMTAYSDDGGRTLSTPVQASDPRRQRVVAPALAIGADHAVHILYYDLEDDVRDYQGLAGPVWDSPWSLVLSTSVDGGRHFEPGRVVDPAVVPPERVMLIFTMPPPSLAVGTRGTVYAAWHDARNGDWDVFLRRSPDGGRSWSSAVRLNDDARGSGAHQYLPTLAVAPSGRLDAIFYDRRRDGRNLRVDVYFTTSADGGWTFAPNVRVTSRSSTSLAGVRYPIPSAHGLYELGARIALLAAPGRAVAAWTEARHAEHGQGAQEVWSSLITMHDRGDAGGWWRATLAAGGAGAGLAAVLVWRGRRKRSGRNVDYAENM